MNGTARSQYDAVVVGAGPNGLSAAITLARAGLSTLLVEGRAVVGGGTRSDELTWPGVVHDVCSAVHPLGVGSPFFRALPLERHGLVWLDSPSPLAHVMDDGRAAMLERSVDATADAFGPDASAYRALMTPFVAHAEPLLRSVLAPLRVPAHPWLMARFGLAAFASMRGLATSLFRERPPGAMLASIAAHAMVPLDRSATASFALVLAVAGHAVGWPVARGGSQSIANALASYYRAIGGDVVVGWPVTSLSDLPPARAYLLDVSPERLRTIAGDRLTPRYVRRLERFRRGPGVFKADWLLRGPIPWADPRCARAVTVHLSGDLDAIDASLRAVNEGRMSERPLVLLGQPSVVDPSRAPDGMHTVWAYCHVPHAATLDASGLLEDRIEAFAPGFRDLVVARACRRAVDIERDDPNDVGGDIAGGRSDLRQLFFRPMPKLDPYATSAPDVFLCSASTPPGGGVHGMCGYWAARSALRHRFGKKAPSPASRSTSHVLT